MAVTTIAAVEDIFEVIVAVSLFEAETPAAIPVISVLSIVKAMSKAAATTAMVSLIIRNNELKSFSKTSLIIVPK